MEMSTGRYSRYNQRVKHCWQNWDDESTRRIFPDQLGTSDVIMVVRNEHSSMGPSVEYVNVNTMQTWKPGNTLFCPRHKYAKIVACNDGYIFALGGVGKWSECTAPKHFVEVLDLSVMTEKNWIPMSPMLSARFKCVACIGVRTRPDRSTEIMLFAVGGFGANNKPLNTIEVFYSSKSHFQQPLKMSVPRILHSAAYHKGCIYVVGGKDDKGQVLGFLECHRISRFPRKDHQVEIIKMPRPLYDTFVIISNNTLYVIGGMYDGSSISHSVYELDLGCKKWCVPKDLAVGRRRASAAVINNTLYVFGGYDHGGKPIPKTEKLRLNSTQCRSEPFCRMRYEYGEQNTFVLPEKLLEITETQLRYE